MPTNDERREVAENLRTMTMRGCRYKEEFYDLLNETVMNEWDFHSFSDVAERLADLIEPEPERKGRNLEGNDGKTRCSECGTLVVDMAYFDEFGGGVVMVRNYPDYCPKCGVRLVEL